MEIEKRAFGEYRTNCYIVHFGRFDIVIDPGIGAFEWVKERTKNPIAVLLTHGHFDHVWDIYKTAEYYNIKAYINYLDEVFLKDDPFHLFREEFQPQYLNFLDSNSVVNLDKINIKFHHLPGHSPGSSILEIENRYFSGDVIFRNSIGRFDFPYSDGNQMRESLTKILENFNLDYPIYPGHGEETTLRRERENLLFWIEQ